MHIYTQIHIDFLSDFSEQKMFFLVLLDVGTEQVWDSIGVDSWRLCDQLTGRFSLSH